MAVLDKQRPRTLNKLGRLCLAVGAISATVGLLIGCYLVFVSAFCDFGSCQWIDDLWHKWGPIVAPSLATSLVCFTVALWQKLGWRAAALPGGIILIFVFFQITTIHG